MGRRPDLRLDPGGLLYLTVLLDLSSSRVVGWAMGQRLTVELALTMALANRAPTAGLLHNSDRGSQSAATSYQRILAAYGLRPSMSRKGNCGDNACVESFFGTLSVSGSIIGATPHETKPSRTSSNISRCSIIGSDGTRLSAITPRPNMKRGRQSLNQVSTDLGEGHPEDSGIADNLRGHNMAEIKEAVEAVEGTHPLSSTYSSDLTPIEQLFAKLHALLRTTATRTWTGTGIKPAGCLTASPRRTHRLFHILQEVPCDVGPVTRQSLTRADDLFGGPDSLTLCDGLIRDQVPE